MTASCAENVLLNLSFKSAASFSGYQYHAVRVSANDTVAVCSTLGQQAIGIVQDEPASGKTAAVAVYGVSKAVAGGTWAVGDRLVTDANGHLVVSSTSDQYPVAIALQVAAANDVKEVLLTPGGITKEGLHKTTTDVTAAQLITSNATPVTVVDYSALVASGELAAGDAIVPERFVCQMYGGTTAYDQDGDIIFKDETTGTSLSVTCDDFPNDATTAGAIVSIAALSANNDITSGKVTAAKDIQLTMTASPKNAAGDMLMRVTTYWYAFTPHA